MIVLLILIAITTIAMLNGKTNRRGGLNQVPNALMATQTWPHRALQVDLGGVSIFTCMYTNKHMYYLYTCDTNKCDTNYCFQQTTI